MVGSRVAMARSSDLTRKANFATSLIVANTYAHTQAQAQAQVAEKRDMHPFGVAAEPEL